MYVTAVEAGIKPSFSDKCTEMFLTAHGATEQCVDCKPPLTCLYAIHANEQVDGFIRSCCVIEM